MKYVLFVSWNYQLVRKPRGTFLTLKVPTKNHVRCRLRRRKLGPTKVAPEKLNLQAYRKVSCTVSEQEQSRVSCMVLKQEHINEWKETPLKATNLFHFLFQFISCFAVDSCHGPTKYHRRTCGCDSSTWWIALLGVVVLKGYANIHSTGIKIFSIEAVLRLAKMLINERHELHIIIFIVRKFFPKISAISNWVDGNDIKSLWRQNWFLWVWDYKHIQLYT